MAVRRRRSLILPLHPRRNRCSPILGNYFLGICFTNTRRKRCSPISGDYFLSICFTNTRWKRCSPISGDYFLGVCFTNTRRKRCSPISGDCFFGYLFHKYPGETVQPHSGDYFLGICFTNIRWKRCSPFTRHSEPVTDVTGVGIRIPDNGERTATPVQPLVHNDSAGARPRVFAVLICGTGRPASPAQGTSRRGCPR